MKLKNFSLMVKNNYQSIFSVTVLIAIFTLSIRQSYVLFHTIIELFSIVVAFAVFIVTWNSRKMQDNNYLFFVGIAYFFIAALDMLHTLTFKGMSIISGPQFYANQFWVATRLLEALTFVIGFIFINKQKRLNADLIFACYFLITVLLSVSVFHWQVFPVCYIEGKGQTTFKVYAEYTIIAILFIACYLLRKNRPHFSPLVYRLLLVSLVFTIISEFCFTLYISNYSTANAIGHYAKLLAFFLIYKANVETGFSKPTALIFKSLKDNEEKYRALAENMPGLITRFGPELNCIYTNEGIMGSASIMEQLRPLLLQAQLEAKPKEAILEILIENRIHYYAAQAIPERLSGKEEQNYLVICQEITELKVAEQELRVLNATKDKLFSIIAHDLRNPFTSLLSYSDIIAKNADRMDKGKIREMALRINQSAKQSFFLLENLLNWCRVQTGALKANPQPVETLQLLLAARRFAEPMALAKNIQVIIEESPNVKISTDEQMIGTVLRNLAGNAIKFSHPGSIVVLSIIKNSEELIFKVADAGVGIKEEVQKRLLLAGQSYTTQGTAAEKGTGLGLQLCKEFVELNGGKLWLESHPGIGTTCFFTLPI